MGEIMANPIGAQFIGQMMAQSPLGGGGDAAAAADSIGMGKAMMEMMKGMPLRTMIAFAGGMIPTEVINGLLAQLNA